MTISLAQARDAKRDLVSRLEGLPELVGIGLTEVQDDYAVQVLLTQPVRNGRIPDAVSGVPVRVDIIGTVSTKW